MFKWTKNHDSDGVERFFWPIVKAIFHHRLIHVIHGLSEFLFVVVFVSVHFVNFLVLVYARKITLTLVGF